MDLTSFTQKSLAPYTTLGVGGVADYVCEVNTEDELKAALLFAKQTATPPLILGGGSNVVLSDKGYRGVVIINRIGGYTYQPHQDGVLLVCGAGEMFDDVIADTVSCGYWGLENLSAIPGSVGATPIQNVGAYGVEVSQLIESVTAIHADTGESKIFSNAACQFGYRDSFFKTIEGQVWVVVAVAFLLRKNPTANLSYADLQRLGNKNPTVQEVRDEIISIRANKFPDWHSVGTVGSFFKNPVISTSRYEVLANNYPGLPGHPVSGGVKISLGWVLDHVCKQRGVFKGSVGLYEKQALVLVAHTGATTAEVVSFSEKISSEVQQLTGITIEREATVYTEFGERL